MADADIATLGINVDSRQVRTAEGDLRGLASQGTRTEQSVASLSSSFRALSGILAAVGVGSLLRDMARTAEQIQNVNIRIQGLTKSSEDYARVTKYISDTADRMHKSNLQLSDSFSKLLVLEQNSLITRKQSMAILEGMANVQSKTGASAEQLSQAMYGFSQAMGMGVVQMEEFKQVTEPLPGLMNEMAKASGVSVGQLRELVKQGQITSDIFGKILTSSLQSYQGAAEAAGKTLTATYADVANAWQDLVAVIESPVSDVISPVLNAISGSIRGLSQDLAELKAFKDSVFKSLEGSAFLSGIDTNKGLNLPSARIEEAKPKSEGDEYMRVKKAEESKKAINEETKALKEQIQTLIKKGSTHTSVAASHAGAAKSHRGSSGSIAQGLSEEQKAANTLATAYQNLDESLRKQLYLSQNMDNKQASLDYDLIHGSLSDLSEQKRLYLMQMQQEIDNNKISHDEAEAKKQEMEQLIDQYNRLTMSAREYYKTQLEGQGIKGEAQKPLLAQYDKNSKYESDKKAMDDASSAIDGYIAQLESARTSMDGLGVSATSMFDATSSGVNNLTGAMDDFLQKMKENGEQYKTLAKLKQNYESIKIDKSQDNYDEMVKKRYEAEKAYKKGVADLDAKTTENAIDGIRQMASATASMFEENSNEAKAFNLIALAGLAAKAATAVLTQGQGDPYSAFARMAAMAALVSGVVAAGGGGGFNFGGGSTSKPPETSTGKGSVLGDKEADSQSIVNIADLLKSIHADEYAELRGINKGVLNLKDAITGTVTKLFQGGGLDMPVSLMKPKISGQGVFGLKMDPIANFLSAGLFGKTTEKLVGRGIMTNAVAPGQQVSGNEYATIERTKKSWFSTKTSYKTQTGDLDGATEEALTNIFTSMSDTMKGVAGSLSKTIGKDIGNRVTEYIIPALRIELDGLTGDEAVKKVNSVISKTLDDMSSVVFGDIIGQYQKLGEGMLETAIRIVAEVAVVKDALDLSGTKMADNAIELSDALVQAAGGLEQFQQQFSIFYDNFFNDAEKQARVQKQLSESFAELYMLLPRTRDEYRKIIEALNLNNKLDRERYSLMMQLSEAASQYYDSLDNQSGGAADIRRQKAYQEIEIMKLLGKQSEALAAERRLELEAMDESLRAMQSIIYTLTDLSGTLQSTYDTAAGMLTATFQHFLKLAVEMVKYRESLKGGELSTGSPESKYQDAKQSFQDTMAIIRGGKGKTEESEAIFRGALENLQDVSGDFLKASREYNASGKGYVKDFNAVQSGLTTGANKSVNIASNAEKQLEKLNDMVSGIADLNLVMIDMNGNIKKIRSNTWKDYQQNKKAADLLDGDIIGLLGNKTGILGQLKAGSPLFKELSNDAVIKALGKDGVLDALMKDGVLEALKTENGITTLLAAGGPIAKALGQEGVLGALGLNTPLLDALGEKGVLKALGKQGVLGALSSGSVLLKKLGVDGILAIRQKGVLEALTKNDGALIKALSLPGVTKLLGDKGILGALDNNAPLLKALKEGSPLIKKLGPEGILAITQKGVVEALTKENSKLIKGLKMPGVIDALGKKGVLGALDFNSPLINQLKPGSALIKALGPDGQMVIKQKRVIEALTDSDGKLIKSLKLPGVIDALGKKGVLGALTGKADLLKALDAGSPLLKKLGKEGILTITQDKVLNALTNKNGNLIKELKLPGVINALGKKGVLGELEEKLGNRGPVKSAVELVKDAINGTGGVKAGGLNFALGQVGRSIADLNGANGIKGAIGDVAVALAGIQAALIALATTKEQENAASAAAETARLEAERIRNEEQTRLDNERISKENLTKEQIWGQIVGASNANAFTWAGKNAGLSDQQSSQYASGYEQWAMGMLTPKDLNESVGTFEKKLSLIMEFQKFYVAQLKGESYPHDGAWFSAQFAALDGRHANGISYVPRDGYIAELHQGERVQTAQEAKAEKETQKILQKIVIELQTANKKREQVSDETLRKIDAMLEKQDAQTRAVKRISA